MKFRIKNLSSFLNVWYEVENLLNNLESKLDCFKLESISKWTGYGDKLNMKNQVDLKMYNELIEKINHANLDEIHINIKQLESKLQLFKQTFDSLVQESGGAKDKAFYVYESYLNRVEKFHLQLDLMREFVMKNKPTSEMMREEHQPDLQSIINQGSSEEKEEMGEKTEVKGEQQQTVYTPISSTLTSKPNQTPESKNNYKLELDINKDNLNYKSVINKDEHNFQLDLHLNDSIDNSNFQMTSTPRFRHIEIENSMNQVFTSKFKHYQSMEPASPRDNLLLSKSLMDRPVKSIEEKSVQTDDIKVMERKEKVPISKLIESIAQDDSRWLNLETPDSGILIDQIESTPITTRHLDRFMTKSPKVYTKFLRERKSAESIDGDLKANNVMRKLAKEEEEIEEEKIELLKPREFDEEQEEHEENVIRVERWQFSPLRFLLYAFMFSLILTTVVYFLLPNIVPSCCDYKREFLIFNEKNLKDDYLPF